MSNLKVPNFESGSYGERCAKFFNNSHTWEQDTTAIQPGSRSREITRAHYPYRYWIEQNGVESKNVFGHKQIIHKMFQVALMSAINASDGMRELEKWYIIQSNKSTERVTYLNHLVQSLEQESLSGELRKNTDFIFVNNLYVPNTDDLVKLDTILELGRLDGYNVVNRPHK